VTGSTEEGAEGAPHSQERGAALAVALLAIGTTWNVGNMGGVVTELTSAFDISLSTVGLLSGTVLLGFSALGTVLAPLISERLGIVHTMILALLLCVAGNLLFAVASEVAALAGGRALAGFGLGLAVVPGPVFARATGGVKRVALFGAAVQLGIAGGLALGSVLGDAGVDWRVTFLISAVVPLLGLPLLVGRRGPSYQRVPGGGFVRLALRSPRVWRLCALFLSIFSVPLILGSWLVHYLSVDNGLSVTTAGVLAFVMFGVSAAARSLGGTLAQRNFSPLLLAGGAAWIAAVGLAILALDDSLVLAAIAVVAAGVGFALPYSPSIVRAQALFPSEPTEPVALMTLIAVLVPMPLVPWFGSLFDAGDGAAVFLGLAAFVAVAGALNLRPVEGALAPRSPA
jgi:predicted MFS family arabinose efflux permease